VETTAPQPPALFRLAGDPVRWSLVRELSGSDRRVRELTAALRLPQSLVSYHLGRLRTAGMVSARRSAADGRDFYYRLDLERCRALLTDAGLALHPALGADSAKTAQPAAVHRRVLFLCTGNSARSQIAEALVEELSDGAVEGRSAGSHPKPLHPAAVRVLAGRGIAIGDRSSKHLETLLEQRFDLVISLCDRVREVCPEFPGEPRTIHWSIADPAAEAVDPSRPDAAFERAAAEIELRIGFLLHQIRHEPSTREVVRR
jgi:ArsR family transcriptional regulator, arsenate/arsenite/antimonite-responsive transcriptional repressor / arsenate reductase (thioredoxin)